MKNFNRCDQKADCEDQSDEASCQIVHLNPEQYLKVSVSLKNSFAGTYLHMTIRRIIQDKAPPPLEIGSNVKIFVNVDIKRVLSISEVTQHAMSRPG